MNLSRRRFLTISAACMAIPTGAQAHTWQGRAFGSDVSITLQGPRDVAMSALQDTRRLIVQMERQFSLYDPASALSQLNAQGTLAPTPHFATLMQAADRAFTLTDGLFDPTVQPLWAALAKDQDPTKAYDAIGWGRVQFDAKRIRLGTSQALTFNGIAQGYATDVVAQMLVAKGFTNTLVNIGEHRGIGGPWTLGLDDPTHGHQGTRTLRRGAIATSSPQATPLGHTGHILHASARPKWSTVSVEAPSATLADSLSTAMVLASRDQIEAIAAQAHVSRVTLVDFDGDLITL